MKFGSLFSGIGGMDLGLERAGMNCAWQVEIDEYCLKVLNKHWPDVPKYKDVKNVGKENLEPVDLIAGGFPCQPHSVAGKRKGAADDRNLWPEYLRIISDLKPRYVLGENVPGIVTTYLDTVLSDLEGEGYTCTTFNIPAVAFDAPHRRERIFVIAYAIRSISESGTRRWGIRKSDKELAITEDKGIIGRKRIKGDGEGESRGGGVIRGRSDSDDGRQALRHAPGEGLQNRVNKEMGRSPKRNPFQQSQRSDWWTIEPNVGRVAHGVPSRVDRLRGLGNAVVPQVAEWIGQRIIEFDERITNARNN